MNGRTAAAVASLVREGDRDRYVATLFAPADRRAALLALHAFDLELSRIPRLARQQIAGEIRLQWWRDAVDGSSEYEALANPVAAALGAAIGAHDLSRDHLHAMIDGRGRELTPEPFSDVHDVDTWCDATTGSLLRCACRVLSRAEADQADQAAHQASLPLGIIRLLMSLGQRAARGQSVVPAALLAKHQASFGDVIAGPSHQGVNEAVADFRSRALRSLPAAEKLVGELPPPLRVAFVPLGTAALRLRWLERNRQAPYATGDVPQWRRIWAMWRAAR